MTTEHQQKCFNIGARHARRTIHQFEIGDIETIRYWEDVRQAVMYDIHNSDIPQECYGEAEDIAAGAYEQLLANWRTKP